MKSNKILTAAMLLVMACVMTGCGQKREAKKMVQHFMECAKDSADKCEKLYPDFAMIKPEVKCDTFEVVSDVEELGDTLAVKVIARSKDILKMEHNDTLTFFLRPDVYDQLRIIGSRGLMKFTPNSVLTYYALSTGANKADDWDYDFAVNLKSVKLMYKSLEEEITEKVKIDGAYGEASLSRDRRYVTGNITINNNLGFEIPSIVISTTLINRTSCASYMAPQYEAKVVRTLKNVPQGGSTYQLRGKLKFPPGLGPADTAFPSEGGFSAIGAIDFKLTDRTIERFIKEHHFSGHEYEDFVKKMQE